MEEMNCGCEFLTHHKPLSARNARLLRTSPDAEQQNDHFEVLSLICAEILDPLNDWNPDRVWA